MDDQYLDLIHEKWNNIAMLYNVFRDKRPIVECDVNSKKIYAYPAHEYINTLTARTRNEAKNQYEETCNNNQFMVFIKDERNKKLRSYIFDVPE